MKTAILSLVAFAFLVGCADDAARVFEPVPEVVEPNDVKVCECIAFSGEGEFGEPLIVCHDQFCDPCAGSCERPSSGLAQRWTCNSSASDWAQFENWYLCEYPDR